MSEITIDDRLHEIKEAYVAIKDMANKMSVLGQRPTDKDYENIFSNLSQEQILFACLFICSDLGFEVKDFIDGKMVSNMSNLFNPNLN